MRYMEKDLFDLVTKGKSQGFLTYEDVNKYLPDEDVSPERLEDLLVAMEEAGIELKDAPAKKSETPKDAAQLPGERSSGWPGSPETLSGSGSPSKLWLPMTTGTPACRVSLLKPVGTCAAVAARNVCSSTRIRSTRASSVLSRSVVSPKSLARL